MLSEALNWHELPPTEIRSSALAIGNFDGVHRGHAALMTELRKQARELSVPAVALTFDPHPLEVLRPDSYLPALTITADRCRLLGGLGADHVLVLRTTPDLLSLSAADFFEKVVRERLHTRAMVEGRTFGFGRQREGNVDTLTAFCHQAGIRLTILPPQRVNGVEVSSSRARTALTKGDVVGAAALLGRPYRLHGTVGAGARRGRTIGFPTANLEKLRTVAPGDGVYAVRTVIADGRTWPGAANIGPKPTFGEQRRSIEVHLIDFDGDLYGQELAVDFVGRLGDTHPFANATELVEQLRRDVEQAKRLVGSTAPADDLKDRVCKVFDDELLPSLAMEGGQVEIVAVVDGVVQVRLHGTCASCPSTVCAVIMNLEEELRKRVPGVAYLEAVP